jgi:hypothetical protein
MTFNGKIRLAAGTACIAVVLALPLQAAVEAADSDRQAHGLDARSIVERAHAAAGGEAWKRPRTLHLVGRATLYRDGLHEARTDADLYEMWRVFPAWNDTARDASGKVRVEAFSNGRVLFQQAFDGEHSWNQHGRVEQAEASREWSENFGFGIIRFALDPGFELVRHADDQVEGFPTHVIAVRDASGGDTRFWIDSNDYSIRQVGFDTARGWHTRIYSGFEFHQSPRFQQPTRVRLYYDGVLTNDIHWQQYAIDAGIADAVFELGSVVRDPR